MHDWRLVDVALLDRLVKGALANDRRLAHTETFDSLLALADDLATEQTVRFSLPGPTFPGWKGATATVPQS